MVSPSKAVQDQELREFSFTSSASSASASPASVTHQRDMLRKSELMLSDEEDGHQSDDLKKPSGKDQQPAPVYGPWWQRLLQLDTPTSRWLSLALGALLGTLLVLLVVTVVVAKVRAGGGGGSDDAPPALLANLTIATPSRALDSIDDCTALWQTLGLRLTRAQPPSVLVSWECKVPTGHALPSTLVLSLSFTSSSAQPAAHAAHDIHDRVVRGLSSAAFTSTLVALDLGCEAEALYQDSLGARVLAVGEERSLAILLPGQEPTMTIKTCAVERPAGEDGSAPASAAPKPAASPATCVGVVTVRNSNNKIIPYHAPRDNCLRLVYAAMPAFAAAGVRVTPWCTQYGNVTGAVQFYQPLITLAQYENLAAQVQSNKQVASAIVRALKLSPCKASISLSALNCDPTAPKVTLTAQTMRDVFTCSPGSE